MKLAGKFKIYHYASICGPVTITLFCLEDCKEHNFESVKALIINSTGMEHHNKRVVGKIYEYQAQDLFQMSDLPPERVHIYA